MYHQDEQIIIHITNGLFRGGVGAVIKNLLLEQDKLGFQTAILTADNEYSVYVKNNTSERINVLFRANSTGEESATRVAAGKGRIADFLQGKGKLFLWTDYLRPFVKPKEYTTFQN